MSITHPLAIILKQAVDGGYDQNNLITLLNAADEEIDTYDFTEAPLAVIASYIHQIYLNNSVEIRGVLIRLIIGIEGSQPESILEKYNLDKLIALSFDHRINQDSVGQTQKDEEKYSAFGLVFLLNKKKRNIPTSIIRAMISYYNALNSQTPNITTLSYKSIIILYFCEAIILNPQQVEQIPDLGQIIVDALSSGAPGLPAMNELAVDSISNLLAYSMEKNYGFVHRQNFLSHLVNPFASLKVDSDSKKMGYIITGVTNILKTWPGLLHAGFRLGFLSDLVECLPHQPDLVISVLRELLMLDDKVPILVPYTGVLLHGLTQLGFVKQLHLAAEKSIENERDSSQPSSTSTISAFLSKLLPFVNFDENVTTGLSATSDSATKTAIFTASTSPKSIDPESIYDAATLLTKKSMAYTMGDSRYIVKQTTVPQYSTVKDKDIILEVLTVIIPHNEIELKSENTRNFCTEVLNSFKTIMNSYLIRGGIIEQCFVALLRLLVTQETLYDILMNDAAFAEKLKEVLEKVKKNELKPDAFAFYFSGITVLTRSERGTEYLKKKGIAESLVTLGSTKDNQSASKVTDVNIAKTIIDQIDVVQDVSIEKEMLISFLNSPSSSIHELALEKVKSYQSSLKEAVFAKDVFESVIIPYVEYSQFSENSIELFVEIVNSNSGCLQGSGVKYEDLFDSFRKQESHFAYSLYFSKPESFKKSFVNSNKETVNAAQQEIEWWMKEGINLYVEQYDNSVAKKTVLPPHIFGMLCKTKEGRNIAKEQIPKLVELLSSSKKLKEKRGALFALAQYGSNPNSEISETLREAKALEAMFNEASSSDSLVFKGSLIVALSMMAMTKYLTSFLDTKHWRYFRFGSHISVVPNDVIEFIGGLKDFDFKVNEFSYKFIDEDSNKKLSVTKTMENYGFRKDDDQDTIKDIQAILRAILLLICPLKQNQARNDLKNFVQSKPKLFERRGLFNAVQEILEKFDMSSDNRFLISKMFAKTPLYELEKPEKFDPKEQAILAAKLFTYLSTPVNMKTLSETQLPKFKAAQLKSAKICTQFPEVYLEDDEFKSLTNKSKDEFYSSLSDQEREKIRKDLLK